MSHITNTPVPTLTATAQPDLNDSIAALAASATSLAKRLASALCGFFCLDVSNEEECQPLNSQTGDSYGAGEMNINRGDARRALLPHALPSATSRRSRSTRLAPPPPPAPALYDPPRPILHRDQSTFPIQSGNGPDILVTSPQSDSEESQVSEESDSYLDFQPPYPRSAPIPIPIPPRPDWGFDTESYYDSN